METEVNTFLTNLEASESTRLAYANDLRVFLQFLDGINNHPPSLNDLNTYQVTAFIEAERQLGRRRNTLIRRLATLKYFQEYLVEGGFVQKSTFSVKDEEIERVLDKVPVERSRQFLNKDQIQVLLAVLDSSPRPRALRDRAILMLLLETGLSVGDLTALDLTDLDMRAGRPDLMLHPGEPALFISQMDGRLSRQGVWQILNHWGQILQPPISLSPRILRHTAVFRMSNAGYSTSEIQLRLGHRSPISTRALIRRLHAANLDQL